MDKQNAKVGLLARLTKRQTNRKYFSTLPVGQIFIITEEVDTPAYDLLGLFIAAPPHELISGSYHYTGLIEKGSWEVLGKVEDCIQVINEKLK